MNTNLAYDERMVHVRFEGQSCDVAFAALDITDQSSPQEVRAALAYHFDVPVQQFAIYIVERHANGNMTVRPEAVFG